MSVQMMDPIPGYLESSDPVEYGVEKPMIWCNSLRQVSGMVASSTSYRFIDSWHLLGRRRKLCGSRFCQSAGSNRHKMKFCDWWFKETVGLVPERESPIGVLEQELKLNRVDEFRLVTEPHATTITCCP